MQERKKEKKENITIRKKKLTFSQWYNCLLENTKESTEIPELLSELNKVTGYQYRSNTKLRCFSKF